MAQKLAEYLTQGSSDHQRVVQFHPSDSYEEFVEGLRPTSVEGAIQFQPVAGHLLRLVRDMEHRPGRHVMVLDEINRGEYKLTTGEWNRADLCQLVAFAAALRCKQAAVINFSAGLEAPPILTVGPHDVRQLAWNTTRTPQDAAGDLVGEVQEWLA